MTVSVLIPTYNRPDLLLVALESLLPEQASISEVLVGDDGLRKPALETVGSFQRRHQPLFQIRYLCNRPSLGQGRNIEALVNECTSDFFVLLHDDDYLLPGAIKALSAPFNTHPQIIASFGNQVLVNNEGDQTREAKDINYTYYRTPEREGIVPGKIATEIQMFPNDGYMVRTEIVRAIGYFDPSFGTSVDTAFGLRLGATDAEFYYVNTPIAAYRLTAEAVSHGSTGSMYHVDYLIKKYPNAKDAPVLIYSHISYKLPIAIGISLKQGQYRRALRWCFHTAHRRQILTPGGLKRVLWSLVGYLTH